uniref:Uncharacterized protein n=1 Tax=Arundo donax TaxID=35708 RepID=A0A0A9CBR8_ARUDO
MFGNYGCFQNRPRNFRCNLA